MAAIRPDDWNLPLFLHILGAMVMVGAIVTACYFLFSARRTGAAEQVRIGFRTLLWVAFPAYIVMRVTAEWIADKQGLNDVDPTPDWIGIGYGIGDLGGLLIIISTIVTGVAVRRMTRAQQGAGAPTTVGAGTAVAAWLTGLLIVAYTVAIWAMATKPG